MAKQPVMDNSYVQLTFKCNENELVALKRAKKEPGALTGKSVVVLKPSDVIVKDGTVFMPNTIEMAQLKKSEKGQFKTNVQISSKMSQMDIKGILEETFPFLEKKRFYCAGAADNRTRLDFHGERRIWDGRLIKQKIKGNSALYIYADEESVEKHELKVPNFSEPTTLKRSHDQITSPGSETVEHSPKKEGPSEDAVEHLKNYSAVAEKHAKRYAASDSPKNVGSYATAGTFGQEGLLTEEMTMEKSDHLSQGDGMSKLQQKLSDRVAVVGSQHGVMLPGSQSGMLTLVQEDMNARDMSTVPAHSMPRGAIMVPQVFTGMVIAQPGLGRQFVPIASDQQSVGKPLVQLPSSHVEARHTGLPFVTPAVPSQTVVSRLNDLKISVGTSQLLQKPVYAEKRDQSAKTVEGRGLLTCNSQGLPAAASLAQSSEPTDSGIETGDSSGANDESALEMLCNAAVIKSKIESGVNKGVPNEAPATSGQTQGSNRATADGPSTSSEQSTLSKNESDVIEIVPDTSSIRGGRPFMIVFNKHLPSNVTPVFACFGNLAPVTVMRVNEFNLTGRIPASHVPGTVTVTVKSMRRNFLGETSFVYVDEVENVLQLLLRDRQLQARYFLLLAQELGNRSSSDPTDHAKEDKHPSEHFSSEKPGVSNSNASTDDLVRQIHLVLTQLKGSSSSSCRTGTCQTAKPEENLKSTVQESGYESDDEASSEEEEEVISYAGSFSDSHNNVFHDVAIREAMKASETDNCEELDRTTKLCARQLTGAPRHQNIDREADKSEKSSHIRYSHDKEPLIGKGTFIGTFKPETVAVKDSMEEMSYRNSQETEPSSSPFNFNVLRARDQTEMSDFVSQGHQVAERIKNSQDPEIVHEQLNCSDTNENSLSDKSRRANSVKSNQMNNNPAEDL